MSNVLQVYVVNQSGLHYASHSLYTFIRIFNDTKQFYKGDFKFRQILTKVFSVFVSLENITKVLENLKELYLKNHSQLYAMALHNIRRAVTILLS